MYIRRKQKRNELQYYNFIAYRKEELLVPRRQQHQVHEKQQCQNQYNKGKQWHEIGFYRLGRCYVSEKKDTGLLTLSKAFPFLNYTRSNLRQSIQKD